MHTGLKVGNRVLGLLKLRRSAWLEVLLILTLLFI